MKKLWARWFSFGVARWDWCLFGLTAIGLGLWASWYLSPESTGPRLRLVWQYDQPPQGFTIQELRSASAMAKLKCTQLESEVVSRRGIRPGSPAAKQLQELLSTATWHAETETFIQYHFNQRRNPADEYDPFFVPFTDRQKQIIQWSELIDEAYSTRSREQLLTALAVASGRPTQLEGFYSNYRDMELLVSRLADGYQVRIGGSYGLSPQAYGYEFIATRNGDVLTGEARLLPEHLSEKPETIVIRFDRGIAEISGQGQFARGTLVRLADLRQAGQRLDDMVALGAGPCSPDEWSAREKFLRSEVVWTSSARPGFFWDAYYLYEVCDEALGGPHQER